MPLFESETETIKEVDNSNYVLILSFAHLEAYLNDFLSEEIVAIDTETSGLNPREDKLVGLSLSARDSCACYIPIRHAMTDNLDEEAVLEIIRRFVKGKIIVFQNSKFDAEFIYQTNGWDVWKTNKVHDTLVLAYMTGKFTKLGGYVKGGLKFLVKEIFDYDMVDISELFGKAKGKKGTFIKMDELSAEQSWVYGSEDAMWTFRLFYYLAPMVARTKAKSMYKVEMELVPIVQKMQRVGMQVDRDMVAFTEKQTRQQAEDLQKLIFETISETVGETVRFKITSPADVAQVLFSDDFMGLPVLKRTKKTNKPSTDAKTLDKLSKRYPIVQNIITYRRLVKFLSGTLETLPDFIEEDGAVHADMLQCHAASGRFAVKNPPLHGYPKKGKNPMVFVSKDGVYREMDNKIREVFIAGDDYYFLSPDYDQVEFRVAMGEADEYEIIRAINKGMDYHTYIASMLFKVPFEDVTHEQRTRAKTYNFALIYGEGPDSLADQLGIPKQEARSLMREYFEMLPGIGVLKQRIFADTRRYGYVETHFGRRRSIPEFQTSDRRLQAFAERTAFSTRIQGTAADICKICMVRCKPVCEEYNVDMVFQHHDSLTFRVPKSVPKEVIVSKLRGALEIDIEGYPNLTVSFEVGDSWGTIEEYEEGEKEEGEETDRSVERSSQKPLETSKEKEEGKEKGEENETTQSANDVEGKDILMVLSNSEIDEKLFQQFLSLLAEKRGKNIFCVKSGEDIFRLESYPTSLDIKDEGLVSNYISCSLSLNVNNVDKKSLGAGIKF